MSQATRPLLSNPTNRGVHFVASDPEMETQKPACRDVRPVAGTLVLTLFSYLFGPPNANDGPMATVGSLFGLVRLG
ncbi:hypothetical protein [Spirosoma areae]